MVQHGEEKSLDTKPNRTLILESDGRTVARTLQLLMDAEKGGILTPSNIGLQEVHGSTVRFGIDLDGAASAMMEAGGQTVAVWNFGTARMGDVPYRLLTLNFRYDIGDVPWRGLDRHLDGLNGLLDVYREFDIVQSLGSSQDGSGRMQVVLRIVEDRRHAYKLVDFGGELVVDFAVRNVGGDTEAVMTTARFGGEFDGVTFTPRVSYADMGIHLPARRIAMCADGTKVVSFADFSAVKTYTASFTQDWQMIDRLAPANGYVVRVNGNTAVYQKMYGQGFGTAPWTTPATSMTDTAPDQATPTV